MVDIPLTFRKKVLLAAQVIQVRLRFVIVLVAAFFVVGQWGTLRNYWDRFVYRVSGTAHASHTVSQDTEYFCPMDPGVLSDWPAICPVCNMDLVRRKKGEATVLPEGVLARMQFSPYRIQLAGIKTSVVEPRKLSREIVLSGRLVAEETPGTANADQDKETAGRGDAGQAASLVLRSSAYEGDLSWLRPGRVAAVRVPQFPGSEPVSATIEAAPAGQRVNGNEVRLRVENAEGRLSPGMFATATVSIPLTELDPFRDGKPEERTNGVLAVPETAVIDTGARQVVYVETMPGMFDGVEVALGPRCGDYFSVIRGLAAGQRVATAGAFLVDAEARLNPSLAAGYFGATQSSGAASTKPAVPLTTPSKAAPSTAKSKLSPADQALADRQKVCPVTDLPLDSMGGRFPLKSPGRKSSSAAKVAKGG